MIDDLYSARILSLAANLPHSGRLAAPEGTAERVAKLCGSKAIVDVVLDDQGRIIDFALMGSATLPMKGREKSRPTRPATTTTSARSATPQ